jgi:predicted phosphodiesterase
MKTKLLTSIILLGILMILILPSCDNPDLMSGNTLPFRMQSPPTDVDYHFNVFGDSRDGNAIYSHLISLAIAGGEPAFSVHVGDMIPFPTRWEQWPIFKAVSGPLIKAGDFWVVAGNHDVNDKASLEQLRITFPEVSASGYYAREHGDILNIFLNSEEYDSSGISVDQLNWLEDQLIQAAASGNHIPIVYSHRPPFPQNAHKNSPFEDNEAIHALLLNYNVPLMLSGHEHAYSKFEKDGVVYVITGGAGSPLHKSAGEASFYHFVRVYITNDSLIVRAIGLFGETHDQFEIIL